MIRPYTIQRSDNGRWAVRFAGIRGGALTIGCKDQDEAETVRRKIGLLLDAVINDEPMNHEAAAWIDRLPRQWRERLEKSGLLDPVRAATKAELSEHFDAWGTSLEAAADGEGRAKEARRILGTWAAACGWVRLADITLDGVEAALANWRKDGIPLVARPAEDGTTKARQRRVRRGAAPHSLRKHAQVLKQFCSWCVATKRLKVSPVAALGKIKGGTRRERRALDIDELRLLIDVTTTAPDREGRDRAGDVRWHMTGAERALLYRLAVETGLRSGELRSLTRASFRLAAVPPVVELKARDEKNRKGSVIRLKPSTAKALGAYLARKAPAAPAFDMPPSDETADMIRADLALARERWIDGAGQDPAERKRRTESYFLADTDEAGAVFDFHALRVTFITNLARAGVPLQTAQKLARHSDPKLTAGIYTKLGLNDHTDAIAKLPDLDMPTDQAAAATGTSGQPIHDRYMGQVGTVGDTLGQAPESDAPNPLPFRDLGREVGDTSGQLKSRLPDSNPRPALYKSAALPLS